MQKYARLGSIPIVTEIFEMWDGPPIEKYFPAEFLAQWIPCPDQVQVNWAYDAATGAFSAPVPDGE